MNDLKQKIKAQARKHPTYGDSVMFQMGVDIAFEMMLPELGLFEKGREMSDEFEKLSCKAAEKYVSENVAIGNQNWNMIANCDFRSGANWAKSYFKPQLQAKESELAELKEYLESSVDFDIHNKKVKSLKAEALKLREALEFYANENKYFMKETEVDYSKDVVFASRYDEKTGQSKSVDVSHLGKRKEKTYECSARFKVDQGKTAREAIKSFDSNKPKGE